MKEKLEQILVDLKAIGVSVSKIETDLGFSNGLLGKVKNGKSNLSDEKFRLVESYYEKLRNGVVALPSYGSSSPEVLIKEEETTTFQGFVELVNPQPEPPIAQTPEKIVLPKARGIMMGSDYLAALPKTTFQNLLIKFNSLVEDLPPINKIEDKLYDLILQAQNSDLTARQAEAIRDRCIYYLKGQYSGQKSKL